MKQIASILLLAVFLFNLVGYKWYFDYRDAHYENKLAAKVDNNELQPHQEVVYKVSAKQLPYYTNNSKYEPAQGEVIVNGVVMQYVKKRIYNDSIEMVCIPNEGRTAVRNARDEFYKLVYDLNNANKHNSNHQPNTKTVKPFVFDAVMSEDIAECSFTAANKTKANFGVINFYSFTDYAPEEKPPLI